MKDAEPRAKDGPVADWDVAVPAPVRRLADRLLPLFYEQLRRLAHRERRRVGAADSLQTTELVHEAYIKLRSARDWNDDTHFLRAAALAMRHALVNHVQQRRAAKRGGGSVHLPLEVLDTQPADCAEDDRLLALHEALVRLSSQSPRAAAVVECRYFGGLDESETAHALRISERTVRRDWKFGRAWLYQALLAESS